MMHAGGLWLLIAGSVSYPCPNFARCLSKFEGTPYGDSAVGPRGGVNFCKFGKFQRKRTLPTSVVSRYSRKKYGDRACSASIVWAVAWARGDIPRVLFGLGMLEALTSVSSKPVSMWRLSPDCDPSRITLGLFFTMRMDTPLSLTKELFQSLTQPLDFAST